MKEKMSIADANKIIEIQNEATAFFKKQEELYQKMAEKYGDSVHYLEHDDPDFPAIKVSITDNLSRLKKGEDVWKSAKFSRFTLETRPLKKMPKNVEEE